MGGYMLFTSQLNVVKAFQPSLEWKCYCCDAMEDFDAKNMFGQEDSANCLNIVWEVDLICEYLNCQGVDPEVGTLVEPDDGNSPLTLRGHGDTMSREL